MLNVYILYYFMELCTIKVPVAAVRSEAYFSGCLISGIAGSNPTKGMDARLLCVLCVA
jgi:hypothetical protein